MEPAIPKAEVKLFGTVKGQLVTEQRAVGGFTSNAAMARIKIPF